MWSDRVKPVLDPELHTVLEKEQRDEPFPLSLKRFAQQHGTERPVHAMRAAAGSLLFRYSNEFGPKSSPVAVERLCGIVWSRTCGKAPRTSAVNRLLYPRAQSANRPHW